MQECAGLLPGSTAEAISDHIQETWARARRAIECLRAKLGDRADELVPLERGGMRLLRIQALMGDGCATQKKVSRLMEKLKKEDGEEMYGAEWNSMDNTITKVLVDVCANHSRNYPIDEWNRKFEKLLSSTLSEDFNTCIEHSGPMARLEKNGTSFLRSFVKLVYGGRGAYEKGEGQRHCLFHFQCFILWLNILYYLFIGRTGRDINLWLEDNYPELVRNSVGRVELSKRQDWSLEVSAKVFPLLGPMTEYLVDSIVLGPNILRDSTLQRMECTYFEGYVHVCAIMWTTVFCELRYLMNSKKVFLNPMEVSDPYDHLWKLAEKMQGPEALDLLEDAHQPWPRVQPSNTDLSDWYEKRTASKNAQKEVLRQFYEREDRIQYEPVLRELLSLFGDAIQESFARNIADYLEATNGRLANSKLSEPDKKRKAELLCHNNAAERTFAVFRSMLQRYPSMSLRCAATISFARLNGTFKMKEIKNGETISEAGTALTADPVLQAAVSELCSVREKSEGFVTLLRRSAHKLDKEAGDIHRKRKREADKGREIEKARKKAATTNAASEVHLVKTKKELRDRIMACAGKISTTKAFLKTQISSRIQIGNQYPISAVPATFRKESGNQKIRLTKPSHYNGDELSYLKDLAERMVAYDAKHSMPSEGVKLDLIRSVPVLSEKYASMRSKRLRADLKVKMETLAAAKDDPLLLQLLEEYKGKLLFVNDDAAWPSQTFRVANVQFYQGKGAYHDSWEATCEPVEMCTQGSWRVPSKYLVPGGDPPVVMHQYLYGVELVSLEDHENPKRNPSVDEYIALHEGRAASS